MIRVMVFALAVSAAAWSVESAPTPGTTTPVRSESIQGKNDPCNFFTKGELEAAFGYALQPARPDAGLPSCSFNGRNNPSITISIDPEPATAAEFNEFLTTIAGDEGEKINGVGDAAFIWLSRIYVRVGARTITISAGLEKASPKVRGVLITLGKTAATRLKQ